MPRRDRTARRWSPSWCRVLTDKTKDDYAALKKERAELERKADPPDRQLALSVNNCDTNPPTTHRARARHRRTRRARRCKPGFPEVLGLPEPTIPAPKAGAKIERAAHGAGGLDRIEGQPDDRPRVREPRLAVPLRPGHRAHARTTSANSANSPRTRNCSTGSRASSWTGGWKLKRLHKLIMMSSAYQLSAHRGRREPQGRSGERAAVAVQHAAAHGRGGPRLDPGRERFAEPQAVRPEHVSEDSEGSARRAIGARPGLADVAARGGKSAKRLRAREAVAPRADPRRLRPAGPGLELPGAVHHDRTDAVARHCSTASSPTSRRRRSPSDCRRNRRTTLRRR